MRLGLREAPCQALWRGTLVAALLGILALPFVMRPGEHIPVTAGRPVKLPARKLVIISPHWEGIRAEFGRSFSDWTMQNYGHPTMVEWLDIGGTSDAVRYVRSQFRRSPQGINIDIFFGGGVDPFLQLASDGLLSPCHPPEDILAPIPQKFAGIELYDPDGRWFGACLGGFGIIYNKRVLEILHLPEPETWEDLARPEYFTWVGSGDPRSSGSVHMAYEIILQAYGWERGWATLVRMGGNIRNFSRYGSEVPKDTALGEVACGLSIDVHAWRQLAEAGAERIGFRLPGGLTVVNPDGIAILKGAPDKDLAEKFIQFVLSEPGQKLWVLKVGTPGGPKEFELSRLPVIPGLAARFGEGATITFDPFTWKGGFTYDAQKGSLRWTILNDLIGATLIDAHGELRDAWRAVKNLSSEDERLEELTRPPLSEEELLRMARERWDEPTFRAGMRAKWSRQAREGYRQIARGE